MPWSNVCFGVDLLNNRLFCGVLHVKANRLKNLPSKVLKWWQSNLKQREKCASFTWLATSKHRTTKASESDEIRCHLPYWKNTQLNCRSHLHKHTMDQNFFGWYTGDLIEGILCHLVYIPVWDTNCGNERSIWNGSAAEQDMYNFPRHKHCLHPTRHSIRQPQAKTNS